MGKNMDGIVVDNKRTAMECIQYMREQRIGTSMFIPLDSIQHKPVNERLRSLGPRYRLCIDVITCEPEMQPAVSYAVANTVVCDSLDAARELCFQRDENVKAVTLSGAMISKAGTMTGGNTAKDREQVSRWDEREFADLKLRRDELQRELADLHQSHRALSKKEEIKAQVDTLKTKEEYALKDQKLTDEKISGIRNQEKSVQENLKRLEAEMRKLEETLGAREEHINTVNARIAKVETKVFAAFSRSVGVANIRDYEATQMREADARKEQRRKVRERRAKLDAQLLFEEKRDHKISLHKAQKRAAQNKTKLNKATAKIDSLEKQLEDIRADLHETTLELEHSALSSKFLYMRVRWVSRHISTSRAIVLSPRHGGRAGEALLQQGVEEPNVRSARKCSRPR